MWKQNEKYFSSSINSLFLNLKLDKLILNGNFQTLMVQKLLYQVKLTVKEKELLNNDS